jgi:glycine/D-amino acid oxidase-like deaminating enzyme
MGHLVVMDDSPAQLALTSYSTRLWTELARELPPDVEHQSCGTLWIAEEERQLASLEQKLHGYTVAGVASHVLTPMELAEAEPHLRPGLAGALHVPGDGVIYPPGAAVALVQRAVAAGATLREGVTVNAIGARQVVTGSETISCDCVINAAGVHAATLTPGLPIVPRKGHLVITERYPGFCMHQLVELGYLDSAHKMTAESIAFNVQPRSTGQLLIGSSRELAGWDNSVNRSIVHRMLDRALDFLPGLALTFAVRTWTGFRPATPDKLPLIGPWEATPGLWIAAGHEGLGITTSLGTAQLLADMILGTPTGIDATPYAPARLHAEVGAA